MASSDALIPVFIDTSLGTRIAMPVSPDITTEEFKREFERVHMNCFPRYGSIKVNGLMVYQKSSHYYLSETLPLKYVLQNSNGTRFLQIEVCVQGINCQIDPLKCDEIEAINHICTADVVIDAVKLGDSSRPQDSCRGLVFTEEKEKEGREENDEFGFQKLELLPIVANGGCSELATRAEDNFDSYVIAQALNESMSESVSVSGIIRKYFLDLDDVASSSNIVCKSAQKRHKQRWKCSKDSKFLHMQISDNLARGKPSSEASRIKRTKPEVGKGFHRHKQRRNCGKNSKYRHVQISNKMMLEKPGSEVSRMKRKKPEVGKRFLVASSNLGLTSSHKPPSLSACKNSDKRSMIHKSASMVRSLVFDMSDEDD